jgi:WD40-like Beta Propeller Repeat
VLALAAFASLALAGCPHDASAGSLLYERASLRHVVSLADCRDRVVGRVRRSSPATLRSPDGRLTATIRASGHGKSAKQTIRVIDRRSGASRSVFSETEYYTTIGPGDTPGPIELLGWSGDDRWIFFTIDPGGSGSIAADGLTVRVVPATGGPDHRLGMTLAYPDYLAWCGGRLVYTSGGDRVATHAKRLLEAGPPTWRPRPLWSPPGRSFGSVACAPDGRSVAVLSQRSSTNPSFFATRWQLWRVGLDGSHGLLDAPPPGFADESPHWSRDGRALAFVRERQGRGELMVWRAGAVAGPFAALGYSPGFYGHHAWPVAFLP